MQQHYTDVSVHFKPLEILMSLLCEGLPYLCDVVKIMAFCKVLEKKHIL